MCNMASSKKKRVEEEMEAVPDDMEDEEDDIDDEEDDSDDEIAMNEDVQLDLEARTPEDCDFHGIKALLQQVFLKANINVSELTDTIISQNYVGSIMKQPYVPEDVDDEDDSDDTVLALTTVINITERKNLDSVQQMRNMLIEKCKQCGKDQSEKFNKILNDSDHHVGYLLNERYINLPHTMSAPLFESLIKEMDKARKKNMKYDFGYLLMICKTFEMKLPHNKKELFFSNSEEELFKDVSEVGFSYSVAHERDAGVMKWDSEEEMEPFRTVILFPADKLQSVIDKIKEDLANT